MAIRPPSLFCLSLCEAPWERGLPARPEGSLPLDRGASAPLRRLMRTAKRRCRGTAERLLRPEGSFSLSPLPFLRSPLHLPPTLISIIQSRRRGRDKPLPQRIAKPSLDRGASAPLRRVFFLFVVNSPPSETISPFTNTCTVGDGTSPSRNGLRSAVVVGARASSPLRSLPFFIDYQLFFTGFQPVAGWKPALHKGNLALLSRGYIWRAPHSANHPRPCPLKTDKDDPSTEGKLTTLRNPH